MRLIEFKETQNCICLRYETTWKLSWNMILDIMQSFLDDIKDELFYAAYEDMNYREFIEIKSIKSGLLYRVNNLKNEQKSLTLVGKSKLYEDLNLEIGITAYNRTNIIDVDIPFESGRIIHELMKNNRLLDNYMNSLEIYGHIKRTERCTIELFSKSLDDNIHASKKLREKCMDLGMITN